YRKSRAEMVQRQVGVESKQRTVRTALSGVHAANDEAPTRIHLAIVQPGVWLVGLRVHDQLRVARVEVQEVKPSGQRQDCAAPSTQRHGAYRLRHVPRTNLAPVSSAAKDTTADNVDPVQALLLHIPYGAFTYGRLYINQNIDLHFASWILELNRTLFMVLEVP